MKGSSRGRGLLFWPMLERELGGKVTIVTRSWPLARMLISFTLLVLVMSAVGDLELLLLGA